MNRHDILWPRRLTERWAAGTRHREQWPVEAQFAGWLLGATGQLRHQPADVARDVAHVDQPVAVLKPKFSLAEGAVEDHLDIP